MTVSLYTQKQRKAYVLAALQKLEKLNNNPTFSENMKTFLKEQILRFTPKGRDPLDWVTEP